MKRAFVLFLVFSACGVDGEPTAPEGAIQPVVEGGTGLIEG